MTSLSFISCSKTYFSICIPYSRFLLKKSISASIDKVTVSRFHSSNAKSIFLKHNLKYTSGFLAKHHYRSDTKVTFHVKKSTITAECLRCFHTSERKYFHPVFWVVFRPVLKFLAVISGRAFRKWWRDLPPNKKKYFLGVMKENRKNIAFFILTSIILSLIYYVSHIEETPITKRRRFMAFNPKQLEQINQLEYQQIMTKMQSQFLPANHPHTVRAKRIVKRILDANQDIKELKLKKWDVVVINSSVENAFVLPIGCVFVYTGMLSLCSSDDELGTILSHEIAHCIQNHGAENISFAHLLDLISIAFIAAIWALIPSDSPPVDLRIQTLSQTFQRIRIYICCSSFTDPNALYFAFGTKLISCTFGAAKCSYWAEILLELPYNRKIETEADNVGLQLAAKACFDVRESSAFWAKMAIFESSYGTVPKIEFLSTHPSHEKRSEYLDSIMDKAIFLRQQCGCPKLKQNDPRSNIEVLTKALETARRKRLEQNPKPTVVFRI